MAVDYDDDSRPSFSAAADAAAAAATPTTIRKVAAHSGGEKGQGAGGRVMEGEWPGRHSGNSKSSVLRTTSARSMQIKWNVRKAQAAKKFPWLWQWMIGSTRRQREPRGLGWGQWGGVVTGATSRPGSSRAQVQPAASLYIVRSFSCASFSHSSHSIHCFFCNTLGEISRSYSVFIHFEIKFIGFLKLNPSQTVLPLYPINIYRESKLFASLLDFLSLILFSVLLRFLVFCWHTSVINRGNLILCTSLESSCNISSSIMASIW